MNLVKWLNDIASSFQPIYNRISAWDLSPELKSKLDDIWKKLPGAIQKALWDLLKKIYDRYGEDAAIMILNSLLGNLKIQIGIQR